MTEQTTPAASSRGELVKRELSIAKQLLDQYEKDLTRVMPRHSNPDTFFGLAAAAVRRDAKLREAVAANPQSFVLALRECAVLGHVPMRGVFDLIPFNNKNAPGGKEVVGVEEYRGVIQRMFNAGGVRAVKAEVGRESDPVLRFNRTRMTLPDHEYDEFAGPEIRGPLKVAYAWAVMVDGTISDVAWLPQIEIAKRRAVSRSGDAFWGPAWPGEGPWTVQMWKKSALHALEPMVPTSAEYRVQVAAAEAIASRSFDGLPDVPVRRQFSDVEDGEVIE